MSIEKINNILKELKSEYILYNNEYLHISRDNLIKKVNLFFDRLHNQVVKEADILINNVLDNLLYNNKDIDIVISNLHKIDDIEDTKIKTNHLMSILDNMILITNYNVDLINYFKNTSIDNLLLINNNNILFKNILLNEKIIYINKLLSNYTWDLDQIGYKNSCSTASNNKILILNNKSCWNFQAVDYLIDKENVIVDFNVKDLLGDKHFFIGICNEKKSLKNDTNCLCCLNPDSWYFDLDGNIYCDNKLLDNRINITNKKNFNVSISINYNAKKVLFIYNHKYYGPFNIKGNQFRIITSTCNNYTGKVEIIN